MKNRFRGLSPAIRYLPGLLLAWLMIAPSPKVFSQSPGESPLEGYISRALDVSPRIQALKEKREALANRVQLQSNLPDPRIAFSFNNLPANSFSFTQEPMTGKMVTLSQALPFPGKLSTRADIAREDERITEREIDDVRNEIARDVKQAYFDLLSVTEAIRIQEQAREVLRGFSQTVRRKYEVGEGSQQDILKSDMEISRVADRILKLQEIRRATTEKLNALFRTTPGTEIILDTLRHPRKFDLSDTLLLATARTHRPLLLGLESARQKSRIQKQLADLAWYPDFIIGAGYTQRDYHETTGTDFVDFASFSLSMNIPMNFGGKKSAAGEEAESLERMYGSQHESVLQQLQKMLGKSLASLSGTLDRLNLLENGLLPQASQALNASLAGYQVGEVDYLTVLDNLVKLFQMESDVYRLRADYWNVIAEIEFLTGGTIQ
jgi:outer membrane protein TolC